MCCRECWVQEAMYTPFCLCPLAPPENYPCLNFSSNRMLRNFRFTLRLEHATRSRLGKRTEMSEEKNEICQKICHNPRFETNLLATRKRLHSAAPPMTVFCLACCRR